MKPGTSIQVQAVDSDHHPMFLGGLIIDVLLYIRDVERYRFDVGHTNERGVLVVTYDQLESIRRENQKFNLMDYNTKLDDCDDSIVVSIPSVAALESMLESCEKWFPEEALHLRHRISISTNKDIPPTECRVFIPDAGHHVVELLCSK